MKYYPPSNYIYYENSDYISASIDSMETDCDKMKKIIENGLMKVVDS